mmetsp:Transcript_42704/g.49077  ORF Transcript_42704/g.49077 Transcript_42704/m.49077 type:complete len:144 (+) Transcript_42704:28-459(+)
MVASRFFLWLVLTTLQFFTANSHRVDAEINKIEQFEAKLQQFEAVYTRNLQGEDNIIDVENDILKENAHGTTYAGTTGTGTTPPTKHDSDDKDTDDKSDSEATKVSPLYFTLSLFAGVGLVLSLVLFIKERRDNIAQFPFSLG